MTIAYGLTNYGFALKPMSTCLSEIQGLLQDAFGNGIDLSGNGLFGQLAGVIAERESLLWELGLAVYGAGFPPTASGNALALAVTTLGQTKGAATYSTVTTVLQGTAGTTVPLGSQASVPTTGATFATSSNITIANSGYLALSSAPVAGVTLSITINTVVVSQAFDTSAAKTMSDFATLIAAQPNVASATIDAANSNKIDIAMSGSAGLTLTSPTAGNGITMSALVYSPAQTTATMTATTSGPVYAPANTLTSIQTPISGWTGVNNPADAVVGQSAPTDAQVRALSPVVVDGGTEQGIENALDAVAGVSFVSASQNTTDFTTNTSAYLGLNPNASPSNGYLLLSSPPASGQTIEVTVNGSVVSQSFVTDSGTTMADLAAAIAAVANIQSAVINTSTGTGSTALPSANVLIDITPKQGTSLTLTNASFSGGTAAVGTGLPPHSIEAFVIGGADTDVAQAVWNAKPAGAQTYGPFSAQVQDSEGNAQLVYWSRGSTAPLYLAVHVGTLTWNALSSTDRQTLTTNLQNALVAYITTLTNGSTIYNWRLLAACAGVASLTDLSIDQGTTPPGHPQTGDIAVPANQLPTLAPQNITVGA